MQRQKSNKAVAAKPRKASAAVNKVPVFQGELQGEGLRIAIVQSRFNDDICNGLRQACIEELLRLGVKSADVFVCTVPGALEIPIAMQRLAATDGFDALVALGAVIRGETYHFELVSNEVGRGVSDVQLSLNIPVANGVLTCDTEEQARERIVEKAQDCAQCAVEMANLLIALEGLNEDE